jgi:hypothetical protein
VVGLVGDGFEGSDGWCEPRPPAGKTRQPGQYHRRQDEMD